MIMQGLLLIPINQKRKTLNWYIFLSAKDFNQGYKRLKYLQQVTKFRRKESEIIMELKDQIQNTKDRLQADLYQGFLI